MKNKQEISIRDLYEDLSLRKEYEGKELIMQGWIRTNRNNGSVGFIEFNDGSHFNNLQLVYTKDLENFDEVEHYDNGVSVTVRGKLVLTPGGRQPFELSLTSLELEGDCDSSYPLQKKRHSFEYMREIAHLRPRANTFYAVFRLRSKLSLGVHEFFQSRGFTHVQTPILTTSDGEGTGQTFTVTTRQDADYEKDYFNKQAFLTGTGQLHAEAFMLAYKNVYTFGPTFRAEKSNTNRHASEFWMIEPEMAFADLEDCMNVIEDMVKFLIQYAYDECAEEMAFFNKMIDKGLKDRLDNVLNSEFKRMSYTEAIDILNEADVEFEYPTDWGVDLKSEHERYICEEIIKGPVFVYDYPKDIKPYYAHLNDDEKTVAAADLLVPGVGEIVGSSQREERIDILLERLAEDGIPAEHVDWYLDIRRFGGVTHSGYGLGFERFIMYLTGMSNIRDVIPFPRTTRNLNF